MEAGSSRAPTVTDALSEAARDLFSGAALLWRSGGEEGPACCVLSHRFGGGEEVVGGDGG